MNPDFHSFLEEYRARHAGDVLVLTDEVSADQEVTAVVWTLAAQGREPMLVFERVGGTKVVTNIFASFVIVTCTILVMSSGVMITPHSWVPLLRN